MSLEKNVLIVPWSATTLIVYIMAAFGGLALIAVADKEAIKQSLEMIQGSIRPLLLIEAGANRTRIGSSLNNFIDKSGIPFFFTQMG